jgi:uncharacterized SAM-binding protein YcdF (DUF218 family)
MSLAADVAHALRTELPSLLIPPIGLLWPIIAGFALVRRHRLAGTMLVGVAIALLYALSTPAVGGALIASLESGIPAAPGDPKAIIILGGDADRTPDGPVKAIPGPLSLQRMAGAAILARQTGLPILITGGAVGKSQAPVADLMADELSAAFGLPTRWRETRAENTCQNAVYSARILRRAGVDQAYVVTHAWHMRRAMQSFAAQGYAVIPAPLPGDGNRIEGLAAFLPHTQAWMRSFYALHEWVGLFGYRLGGCAAVADDRLPAAPAGDPPDGS